MLNELSEAQRLMLQAAAARQDRLVQPPANARGAVAKAIAGRLIDARWAKEIKAPNGAPIWRRDAEGGSAFTLKLTAKGLRAVAVASGGPGGSEKSVPTAAKLAPRNASVGKSALPPRARGVRTESKLSNVALTTTARAPRAGCKLGSILAILSAEADATIGELMAATGWLEHSTRAALTGLRRRGYGLSLTRSERDGASVYRIAAQGDEAPK
jgi:hypothetical protein